MKWNIKKWTGSKHNRIENTREYLQRYEMKLSKMNWNIKIKNNCNRIENTKEYTQSSDMRINEMPYVEWSAKEMAWSEAKTK